MACKFFISAVIILFTCINGFSQGKRFLYFFDEKFEPAKKSKAVFTGTGIKEDGLLSLQIVDNATNKIIIWAHYTDSSLTVSQGLTQTFFSNGIIESEGSYDNNKKNGIWKKWDNTGQLLDSTIYDHNKKLTATTLSYYKSGRMNRFEDFNNDKMQQTNYNDSGKITSEAFFTGNIGIVKKYNKEGIKIETYIAGRKLKLLFREEMQHGRNISKMF